MSGTDYIDAGYDTARLTNAEADQRIREERAADARRYLERTHNTDLLPILGLADEPGCCRHCGVSRAKGDGYCMRRVCRDAMRQAAKAGAA